MKRVVKALVAGLLLAIAGSCLLYTQYGQNVEESLGLALLFRLRGPRESPKTTVIINIDDNSSSKLGLSVNFSSWPRTVHAALVDKLVQYGAKVIAFDIFFAENRDREQDLVFAEAIRRAGNVILVEEMQHRSLHALDSGQQPTDIEIDTLLPPIEPLADAALALAPFPLPKLPVRVNTTWRFKPSCGNTPTLPTTVFQAANLEHFEQLQTLLREKVPRSVNIPPRTAQQVLSNPGLTDTIRNIRELFLHNSGLKEELLPASGSTEERSVKTREALSALIAMYGGTSRGGIDFYGPPGTHPTFSYYDILAAAGANSAAIADVIRDKAVFIGAARTTWSNQKDGFYTVFSQADGLDLSGVELAATVFANLSENRLVHQLAVRTNILILFACAMIASVVSFLLAPPAAASCLLGTMVIYLLGAHAAFSHDGTWMPVITPLVFLPFSAFGGAILCNYLTTYREHRNTKTALGFYLPDNAVMQLSKDLSFINKGEKKVYSTCLLTDAQSYTALSENLPPEELSAHLKEYFEHLFKEVKKKDGLICNTIGDSMLAHWPSAQPEVQVRQKGCKTALAITGAVERFNSRHPDRRLPTRIGLHCGYLLMDNIGAEDHFEYTPVGDIVNTVSRIEGLNKRLGTQILASEEVLQGVTGVESREIGYFLLSGKTLSINIYELLVTNAHTKYRDRLYKEVFPEALLFYRTGKWEKALAAFGYCLFLDAEDGPSRFYKQLCESYLQKPPSADWQGIAKVGK